MNEKSLLENEDIENAGFEYSSDGNPEVSIQFKENATRRWAAMTRKNIGLNIGIIINNKIIAAPNVSAPVEDGKTVLSGSYTIEECRILSTALKTNILNTKLSILSSSINQDKDNYELKRKLLTGLLSFVIASGIAFFVFKTLKST